MIGIIAIPVALKDTLYVASQASGTQWQDVLSILAALFSALLVYVAWATLREHNRPYVTLYAEAGARSNVNLVIKNSGNRAAYNVSVKTDVPLESVYYSKKPEFKLPFVTEKTHPFIGPDQSLSSDFDVLPWRYNRRVEDYQEPCDKYTVTIEYWHKKRRFVDKYQLDFSYLEFMPWGYSRDHISDISSSLKKISDQLPGGMIHSLQNMFKNVPSKYQRDDKEQNVDSSIEAEDAENEPK